MNDVAPGAIRILRFDLTSFAFPAAVAAIIGDVAVNGPEAGQAGAPGAADHRTGQHSAAHHRFYSGFDRLRPLYDRFLSEFIAPLHGEDLCVQAVPTFRVHPPGGVAVHEFHRDSDYNHQPGIINYWLPLTKAFDTNSIWLETEPDSRTYAPAELGPGEVLEFDAVHLRHGNHPNTTGMTRLSFDFRVVPLRVYEHSDLASVAIGQRLALGDYYRRLAWPG